MQELPPSRRRRPAKGLVIGVEVVQPAGFGQVVQSAGRGLSAGLFLSAKFRKRRLTRSSGASCDSSASTQAHGAQTNCNVGVQRLARLNELEKNR
jgi:hypothetical protein